MIKKNQSIFCNEYDTHLMLQKNVYFIHGFVTPLDSLEADKAIATNFIYQKNILKNLGSAGQRLIKHLIS